MPLTGIGIFKLLPKTNCGDCGVPTCLAFAMSLASGKASLSACPHVSEEAKVKLEEASAPPILPVTIGTGDKALKVGGETVMFRHEKRFENPSGIAILISDTMDDAEVDARLEKFKTMVYERVGLTLAPELAALKNESGDTAKFENLVTKVTQNCECSIVLMSDNTDALAAGLKICEGRNPLLYAATEENADRMVEIAKESSCSIAAKAADIEGLARLTEKLTAAGVKRPGNHQEHRPLQEVPPPRFSNYNLPLRNDHRPDERSPYRFHVRV